MVDIEIFTTGGTIDKLYFDALSEYQIGSPQVLRVLQDVGVDGVFRVSPLMRKDSLDITESDRQRIVDAVQNSHARKVIITHGTDTMVDTGKALSAVSGKTIVLVGAMQPAGLRISDAEFNIGFAWGAVQTLPHGVYVAMNGKILDPQHARKNRDAHRFEATS